MEGREGSFVSLLHRKNTYFVEPSNPPFFAGESESENELGCFLEKEWPSILVLCVSFLI